MKKFFTLVAVAFMALNVVNAESVLRFVDADGKVIADGATLTMDVVEEDIFGDTMVGLTGVFVENTSEDAVGAYMRATIDEISFGSFACCLGTQCRSGKSNGAVLEINNVKIDGASKLEITNTEWTPNSSNSGSCVVTIQLGTSENVDGPKLTINFTNATDAVKALSVGGKNAVARYTLDGRQTSTSVRGVQLVRYADGSIKKVVNK